MCHRVVIVERRSAEIRLTFLVFMSHIVHWGIFVYTQCYCDSDNLVLLRSFQSSGDARDPTEHKKDLRWTFGRRSCMIWRRTFRMGWDLGLSGDVCQGQSVHPGCDPGWPRGVWVPRNIASRYGRRGVAARVAKWPGLPPSYLAAVYICVYDEISGGSWTQVEGVQGTFRLHTVGKLYTLWQIYSDGFG